MEDILEILIAEADAAMGGWPSQQGLEQGSVDQDTAAQVEGIGAQVGGIGAQGDVVEPVAGWPGQAEQASR